MRIPSVLLCIVLFSACSGPRNDSAEQERRLQEELKAEEQAQEAEQVTEHKDPDGTFGAKDYANEAREQSDRNTKALEEAAEVKD